MSAIREVADQVLRWTQPTLFAREFELHAGDEVVGTLRWQKTFGSLALAEAADGAWTFKRSGFLRPRVTVRLPGSEPEVAVLEPGWRGEGSLVCSDGRWHRWQNISFWRSEWAFADDVGETLVHFAPEFAFLGHAAEVKFGPRAASVPDLSLLTLLGWYLMVLMSQDTGGAAAGVLATGSRVSSETAAVKGKKEVASREVVPVAPSGMHWSSPLK
jgi:hypothetical protein